MNGLIAWWARNSVAANLLMVSCLIAGFFAYLQMEREVMPTYDVQAVTATVAWPGAAPQEVEEQIVLRIEEAASNLDNIDRIESEAAEGFATVNIFIRDGVDRNDFLNKAKAQIDGINNLPADAFPPVVRETTIRDQIAFLAVYGEVDERTLTRYARELRKELAQLSGSSNLVELVGVRDEEVAIEVSEAALRRYGLTFDEVARAIRGGSVNLSSGTVRSQTGVIPLRARSLADTQQDFEDIVLRQTAEGATVRIKDVATVIDGFEDVNFIGSFQGAPGVLLRVDAPDRVDVVAATKAIRAWVPEAEARAPEGVQVDFWFDGSIFYTERMELVSRNALLGLVLVAMVLVLFLHIQVAFWVAAGIGVSFAGAFIFMPAAGVSLNMLSTFAFLLVLGVVVDDAIIVGESIHRQVERGQRELSAAVEGAQLVSKPVIFAVLTTMIAFLPWLFISSEASSFMKHITLTIVFALSFSIIESFFILPAHLSHLKPERTEGRLSQLRAKIAASMNTFAEKAYRPIAEAAVRARYVTIALFFVAFCLAATFMQTGWVAFAFFPKIDSPFIEVTIKMPEGSPFTRNEQIHGSVLAALEKLEDDAAEAGASFVDGAFSFAGDAQIASFVLLTPTEQRNASSDELAKKLRSYIGDIPDAESVQVASSMGQGEGNDLSFGIEGRSLEVVAAAAADLSARLRASAGTFDIEDNLQSALDEMQIVMKPGAERFGLTLAEVSRQVRQAYYGEEVQRLPRGGEDVRVMVRYPKSARTDLSSLDDLRIRTAEGAEVPFSAVAEAEFAPSYRRILRRDRQKAAEVSADLQDGVTRTTFMQEFDANVRPELVEAHPDAIFANRGEAEEEAEFLRDFAMKYLLALGAMYALLAIAFGSYWQPLLIMTAIPFGFMGAVFGHLMFDIDMALFSYFGIGAAAGVVINDNLVLVDYVNRLRAQGAGAFDALIEAGTTRFRPIILTSVTTVIGLMPILAEQSVSAQFLQPTVVSLAFGVFFAMFVTLLFVPAMYAVGVDIARGSRRLFTGKAQPAFGEGHPKQESPAPAE